jgi:hypothetical protein
MFKDIVKTKWERICDRNNKNSNEPTDDHAQILYFGTNEPKWIMKTYYFKTQAES